MIVCLGDFQVLKLAWSRNLLKDLTVLCLQKKPRSVRTTGEVYACFPFFGNLSRQALLNARDGMKHFASD